MLDSTHCYRALQSRDHRFDGKFFVGVSSTGIYCRPVCTAKTPQRTRCTFFPSAAAAEHAGFRPCLRCRPELAPGNACVDAPKRIAHAAASLIEDGFLEERDLEALSRRLGCTDRHLRRVFQDEFGVSPVGYAQTQRLLLAKRLLTDTALPVTDIAMASGFGSLRRFNALFQERYRMAPSRLRSAAPRDAGSPVRNPPMRFELAYRPPLAWDAMLEFLALRAISGVEMVTGREYRRTVAIAHGGAVHHGWIAAQPSPRKATLRVVVAPELVRVVPGVLAAVKRLFDLACDPAIVEAQLGPLAAAHPGLRVPGAFDGFEMAVRAIVGQQVTVKAATTLSGRLARAFGAPVATPWPELTHAFPSAATFASLGVDDIAKNGITGARSRSLIGLAQAIARGDISLLPGADVETTMAALRALPGIGEWTAQYLAMRALAWPDAFPHTDLGVMKALQISSPAKVLAAAERWRPWRAYAVIHLWHALHSAPAPDSLRRNES